MRTLSRLVKHAAAASSLAVAAFASPAGELGGDLQRAMAVRGTHADTAVLVRFVDPVEVQSLAVGDRRNRDNRVMLALRARAARQRATIEPLLSDLGARRVRDLWLINGLAVTLPAVSVKRLAAHPTVARIDLDSFVQGGRTHRTPARHQSTRAADPATNAPALSESGVASDPGTTARSAAGWNIAAVQAPSLWSKGFTGRGVVVASMDTGVDLAHPDLRRKWRGGPNSWFDPHGEEPEPYDALGHGTQAMGIVLGGRSLGVAPDARWIAARLFNAQGHARMSDIHLAFQWLIDPDGDPATMDAPDIVNASWALIGRASGACIGEFSEDLRALRSAGIAVVFAAGNDGPAPRSSSSPANNPGVLSVGALNGDLSVARQSSRGPSSCDGGVFPKLVAPGVGVRTADLSHGVLPSVALVSGSSLAAPHVAGVLALLMQAAPSASLDELEAAMLHGARDLGDAGPDPSYGHGLVDALAALEALRNLHTEVAPARGVDHDVRQ